jgi:hypothetical protein
MKRARTSLNLHHGVGVVDFLECMLNHAFVINSRLPFSWAGHETYPGSNLHPNSTKTLRVYANLRQIFTKTPFPNILRILDNIWGWSAEAETLHGFNGVVSKSGAFGDLFKVWRSCNFKQNVFLSLVLASRDSHLLSTRSTAIMSYMCRGLTPKFWTLKESTTIPIFPRNFIFKKGSFQLLFEWYDTCNPI